MTILRRHSIPGEDPARDLCRFHLIKIQPYELRVNLRAAASRQPFSILIDYSLLISSAALLILLTGTARTRIIASDLLRLYDRAGFLLLKIKLMKLLL